MQFFGFLLEDSCDINFILKKYCKEYLSLLQQNNIPGFYRGVFSAPIICKDDKGRILRQKTTREHRNPKGMPDFKFDKFNTWIEKNGHLKRDMNVCIATSNKRNAEIHGQPLLIYPIGKIRYTWCKEADINNYDIKIEALTNYLFSEDDHKYYKSEKYIEHLRDLKFINSKPENKESILKDIENSLLDMFVTDKDIKTAYINSYEIWFKCDKYYLVNDNEV